MKDDKIIIRVDKDSKDFLKSYAANKKITISKIFRDWIDWLKKREDNESRDRRDKEICGSGENTNSKTNDSSIA